MGVSLGSRLVEVCNKYGFSSSLPIAPGPNGETIEAVPSLGFQWTDSAEGEFAPFSKKDFKRNPKLVAQGSIGQNIVQVTPLQMAAMVAAIANEGTFMKPRLVLESADSLVQSEVFSRPLGPHAARQIIRAMRMVSDEGTARHLKKIYKSEIGYSLTSAKGAKQIAVASKTGTAEVQGRKSHSWFVCFAPDVPQSPVVCVLVEHAGYGAKHAGPVGIEVLKTALNATATESVDEFSDDI